MNESDFQLLEQEAFHSFKNSAAVSEAVLRIQRDMSTMLAAVTRIERSINPPTLDWCDEEDLDLNDPPF